MELDMSSSKTSTNFLELDYAKHALSSVRSLYSLLKLFLQYSLNVRDSRAILKEEVFNYKVKCPPSLINLSFWVRLISAK
jgi:hypothetical protein